MLMTADKTKDAAARKKNSFKLMKRLVKTYLAPYYARLLMAVVLMAIAAAMTAAVAQLMQPILDDVLGGQKTEIIIPVSLAVMAVFIGRGLTTYGHTIMMSYISQSIVADIQRDLCNHFLTLLFLGFIDATSRTSGFCASCGCSVPAYTRRFLNTL